MSTDGERVCFYTFLVVSPATLLQLSLSREYPLHRVLTGGPHSTTPVLLELCVDSLDTAPPPQDLLAGILYTTPPPSTGDGSLDSYLESP